MTDRPLTTGEGNTRSMRARAEAWLAGRVRRDMAASIATATDLARDVVALGEQLTESEQAARRLREQLDAARQALEQIMAAVGTSTEAHLIARAALGVEGPAE